MERWGNCTFLPCRRITLSLLVVVVLLNSFLYGRIYLREFLAARALRKAQQLSWRWQLPGAGAADSAGEISFVRLKEREEEKMGREEEHLVGITQQTVSAAAGVNQILHLCFWHIRHQGYRHKQKFCYLQPFYSGCSCQALEEELAASKQVDPTKTRKPNRQVSSEGSSSLHLALSDSCSPLPLTKCLNQVRIASSSVFSREGNFATGFVVLALFVLGMLPRFLTGHLDKAVAEVLVQTLVVPANIAVVLPTVLVVQCGELRRFALRSVREAAERAVLACLDWRRVLSGRNRVHPAGRA